MQCLRGLDVSVIPTIDVENITTKVTVVRWILPMVFSLLCLVKSRKVGPVPIGTI